MQDVIYIKNFSFKYTNKLVLKDINLSVCEGKCLGIVGKNGSGKTALINCIIGELKGDGEVKVFNMKPNIYSSKFKYNIGVVLDDDILIDYLTLNEYLNYIGKLFGISNTEIEQRINYWLDFFELNESRDRILKFFSHGMRKKTQIIASLIHNPKLLIIDEPTNGLDIEMIYVLKEALIKLKKSGLTIIVSTHILSFIEDICDDVIIIHEGLIKKNIKLNSKEKNYNLEKVLINEIINVGDLQ